MSVAAESPFGRTCFLGFLFFAFAIFVYLGPVYVYSQALTPEEEKLEKMMMIHYLRPEYKSEFDKVSIQGTRAKVQVWRDLPPNPQADRIECLGYEWLLTGRGEKMGLGAYEVFKDFPGLTEIELQLADLDFSVKSADGKGKFTKESTPKIYLKMTVKRSEIEKFRIDNQKLRSQLKSSLKACLGLGRRLNIAKEINL